DARSTGTRVALVSSYRDRDPSPFVGEGFDKVRLVGQIRLRTNQIDMLVPEPKQHSGRRGLQLDTRALHIVPIHAGDAARQFLDRESIIKRDHTCPVARRVVRYSSLALG